jgi:hypothetical protein
LFGERAAIEEARRKADAVNEIFAARVLLDDARRREVRLKCDLE